MSLFFGDFPTEDTLAPTVSGSSAGMNSAMFFTCPACGACVVDTHYETTNRHLHDQWHAAGEL
jgi:hypothetical protein